ncbi:MAG: hypothetical protein R3301_01660, partial [Saprospiraceae bacterium]|nr:hypothetical protein [Saprospiraceae bacterium]
MGCPTPEPINGCAGQEEIDQAFQNWANTFPGGSSGNCAPVITYQVNGTGQYSQSELAAVVAGVTPDACAGGFVEIVCTSVDPCQPSNPPEICVSVYEVFPATPLPLLCPPVQVLEACDGQAAINAAFIGWATSFGGQGSMTGLCVPVVTYSVNGSGTFSQSELVDLLLSEPPNACDGAAIVVECTGVDGCGGVQTCFSEFFVIPPPDIVAPDCPGSVFVEGCDGQAAINIAFAGWLNGFGGSATGGCNPVVTYSVNGSGSFTQSELFDVVGPPDACAGGTIDITCTVQDACGSTSSCSSTFFVNPAEVTGASCPPSQIVDGDAGQAQVDFAFANWASSFATNASGGCNPVITYSVNGSGSFSPAQLLQVLVPPNACTGGVVDVECTITDICGTATCQSFFEVLPTSPLEIECPPSDVIECADQATINAAFLNWANSFGSNVTGSTSPVIIYSVNGSGSFTQSELVDVIASSIPQACSGGTITVVCTATNGCETATCTSSLTVLPPPTLTDPGCPPTQVLEGCIGQPAINQAFANWANSFAAGGVTGSCDPVITYSVNGSGSFTQSELVDVILGSIPGACEGGSITVVCTASNGCETASCSSTLIVDPATAPAPLACPPPVDVDGCAGQDAINNAFATWLGSFSSNVTGGCDPVVTYSVNGVGAYSQSELSQVVNAPDACSGGSVVIVCTVEDVCGSQSCTSTFDVTPVPAIDVSCPPSQSLSGCVGQQFIDIAFANWANSFSSNVTGGCSPVLEYFVNGDGPFSPTALLGVLSPPSSCTGGVVSVVCVVSDVCGTQTCESTFSVEAVSPLEIECPPSDVIEGCIGQAAVDAAFINWASSFGGNATGGCNPVITYSVNGSGSYTQSELVAAVAAVIPPACEGGSVVVVCTATNGCETQTCSSQLVVDATSSIPPLECPPSETLECVDQATINAAFLAWANSFGAGMSGTCAPVITYSVNGSGSFTQSELVGVIASSIPDVCTGGSIEVVCTATNECGGTSVCSSTLTVAPPQPLGNITCPDSEIHDGCIGQAAIDAAFESWYSGFGSNVTGGCNPVITYSVNGSGSFTQSELVDVLSSNPPSACDGGVVTVTCTASNGCTSVTCSSSFTVTPADVMTAEIECPANVDLDGCIGQTAIDAAFAAWSSAFTTTVTGGCVPVITYTLNGSGPLTPAELLDALVAPDACEGG